MRVIAGEFRSRLLKSVPGLATRPTPDRLRETLFNILGQRVAGAVFADLYAGTGAVGIEALSRGAARAIFVESNRTALGVIRDNLRSLGVDSRAEVRQGPVLAQIPRIQADFVFLDPPYHLESEFEAALQALSTKAPVLVVVQHDRRLQLAPAYGVLVLSRTLKQGDNVLSFYTH